ncbi:MAG: S-layer homology domain-containing protein [Acutalibacter sp.]|nr:S-layer homology domain-containing protein [Acutalibacter sp.]
MKKRIIAILLTLSMVFTMLSFSGCQREEEPADKAGYTTHGEWITMLAEGFGFDTYYTDEPYYSDVSKENPLFPAVQSLAEWGILSVYSKDTLEADKLVIYDEAASTAAIAAGFRADGNGEYSIEDSIDYAVKHGIVSEGGSKYLTPEECAAIVQKAYSVYLNDPGEETAMVVSNEKAVDLSGVSPNEVSVESNTVTISSGIIEQGNHGEITAIIPNGSGTAEISIGDTFIAPATPEYPWGIAYKVSNIQSADGAVIFTTAPPTLEDLYDELNLHTSLSADLDNIVWADGVSASPATKEMAAGEDITIGLMSFSGEAPTVKNMGSSSASYSNSWSVTIGNGYPEKAWGITSGVFGDSKFAKMLENSNFVYEGIPGIEDFNGSTDSWTKELDTKDKFSHGYKITGKLSVNALTVTADIQYKKGQIFNIEFDTPIPKSASLAVSSDITAELGIEGNLSGRLKIATIPIPLPAPGLAVSVDLYLYTDASGSLQVEAGFGYLTKIEWRDGDKIRKVQENSADIGMEAAMEVDFGADLSASLDAFGLEIIDIGAKAGGNLTANASISGECNEIIENGSRVQKYQEKMNLQADLYAPIITLYLGGDDTLLGKIGISGNWDIVSKENGAKRFPLISQEWVFWEDTVALNENGEPIIGESTDTSSGDTPSVNVEGVNLSHTYATRFEEVNAVTYPSFSFDYPDGWKITVEDVQQTGETVEVSNDRGVTVKYSMLSLPESEINRGNTNTAHEVNITKTADSSFIPGWVQNTDHSSLGSFMVAKIQWVSVFDYQAGDMRPLEDGETEYAVLPETSPYYNNENPAWLYGVDETSLAFWYSSGISFIAHAPTGKFTEQEEKEVIAILSSFRTTY